MFFLHKIILIVIHNQNCSWQFWAAIIDSQLSYAVRLLNVPAHSGINTVA